MLALNYGGRDEIVDAVRALARAVRAGAIDPEDIDEAAVARALYTDGMPDPDLLIRTSGEMRVSNFLLWQIAYTELWVTPTLWPDFGARDLYVAVADFQRRRSPVRARCEGRGGGRDPPGTVAAPPRRGLDAAGAEHGGAAPALPLAGDGGAARGSTAPVIVLVGALGQWEFTGMFERAGVRTMRALGLVGACS